MFSNTIKGIKADIKPAYNNARSAGVAWLTTSRKSLAKGIHQIARVVDA